MRELYYDAEADLDEDSWGWEDELEAFDMAEDDLLNDDYYESSEDYELGILGDSAELAEGLREVMHEDYWDAPHEEMEEALFNILDTMTPAEGFNFKKALSQVLGKPIASKYAKAILPAAGTAVGTIYGGPAGAAVGAKLGSAAGQAFSGGRKSKARPRRKKTPKPSAKGGSAAAAQLLQLTQKPDMLKSLLALSLGANGQKSVKVGSSGPSVPVGGFMNLLSILAGQAAADADEILRENDESTAYLRDSEGELIFDPANPSDRAEALYETLDNAENEELVEAMEEDYGWGGLDDFEADRVENSIRDHGSQGRGRRVRQRAPNRFGRYRRYPRRRPFQNSRFSSRY